MTTNDDQYVERLIVDFFENDLGGIDLLTEWKPPRTADQTMQRLLSGFYLVTAVSQDVALVVSFGASEGVTQYINCAANLISVTATGVKAVELDLDAIEDVANGDPVVLAMERAGGKFLVNEAIGRVPLARTAYAYGNFRGLDEKERREFKAQAELVAKRLAQGQFSDHLTQIYAAIENVTDFDRREEFKRVIQRLMLREGERVFYQTRIWSAFGSTTVNDASNAFQKAIGEMGMVTVSNVPDLERVTRQYMTGELSADKIRVSINGLVAARRNPMLVNNTDVDAVLSAIQNGMDEGRRLYSLSEMRQTSFADACFNSTYDFLRIVTGASIKIDVPIGDVGPTIVPQYVVEEQQKISDSFREFKTSRSGSDGYPNLALSDKSNLCNFVNNKKEVVAIIDTSQSNSNTDPSNLRAASLEMMAASLGDDVSLAIVSFNSKAKVVAPMTPLGPIGSSARRAVAMAAKNINAEGLTSISAGLRAAENISVSNATHRIWLLLTDGKDPRFNPDSTPLPSGVTIHTIALADQADRVKIEQLSRRTNGNFEIARTSDDLKRIISLLFGEIEDVEIVELLDGTITQGSVKEYSFYVDAASGGSYDVNLTWPGSDIDMTLLSPSGRNITIDDAVRNGTGDEGKTYEVVRLDNPEPGQWTLRLLGVDIPDSAGEPFNVRVVARDSRVAAKLLSPGSPPAAGQSMKLAVRTNGDVTWERVEYDFLANDGKVTHGERKIPFREAVTAVNELELFSIVPREAGYHRLKARLIGTAADGSPISRVFDRTYNVGTAKQGGNQLEYMMAPFIGR